MKIKKTKIAFYPVPVCLERFETQKIFKTTTYENRLSDTNKEEKGGKCNFHLIRS